MFRSIGTMPRAAKQPRLSCRLGCLCRNICGANARQFPVSTRNPTCGACGQTFCSPECLSAHQKPGDKELRMKKNCRGSILLLPPASMVAIAQPGASDSAAGELGSTHTRVQRRTRAFFLSPLTAKRATQVFRCHGQQPWMQQRRSHAAAASRSVHPRQCGCST